MKNIITVKAIDKKPWSNVIQYKNCHTDVATYWLENGSKYTGLSKEDENRLGELLRQDLHPNSDYWDRFFIRMTNDDLILDINDPNDELKYLFLKNHKLVQKSIGEKKATAMYVIVDETAEAKETNKTAKVERKAVKEFDKLSATDIRKVLRLYGYKAESMGAEQAEAKLYDLVKEDPNKFLTLWVDNETRDTQYLIESALSKNVLRRNKNIYTYGTSIIGHSLEETIAFLEDKKNSDIKKIILDETNIKA